MRSLCTWAAACAVLAAAPAAMASPLLNGSTVTAVVSGPATFMLGADNGYAAVAGSNVTAVTDSAIDPEFISDDFAIVVDISSDGRLAFIDNTGFGDWTGRYEFEFSFSGAAAALASFVFEDLSALTSGSVLASVMSPTNVRVVFDGVQLGDAFLSLEARVGSAAATLGSPGTLGLAALALGLAAARRRGVATR
jgi:hypothetical protein